MRKSNPQFRWHISQKEKDEIRRMTLKGIRQSVIARKLGIAAPSVSKAQRAMGLPTRLVIPEDEIMRLFREGWGGYRIHKHLKIPVNQIFRVAHENGFRRADGIGYPEPRGDIAGFTEAILRREDYVRNLAKKYGVGFCQARKIAHDVLGCPEFRPGASQPPLSSNFPQKQNSKRKAAR